jgi:Glycosyltransferase family 87
MRAFAPLVDATSRWLDRGGRLLSRYGRPIRDALVIVGLARAAYYFFVQGIQPWTFIGLDTRAYWQVDLAHPYVNSGVGEVSTYLYSPAFAQAMAPFSLVPFPVFAAGWILVMTAIFAWLVRPWPWAALILLLPVVYELLVGNIHFLIAAAIVLSFRAPAAWALPVLTKITPAVGMLWYPVRGEWRNLAIALGTIGGIVLVSFVLAPSAWFDWIRFLVDSPGRSELLLPRLVLASLLVVVGAATGRRWFVPVAVMLALPVVWVNSWVILLAVIRLRDGVPPITAALGGTSADGPRVPVTGRTTAP